MILVSRQLFLSLILVLISCQPNLSTNIIRGYTQGTTYTIKYNCNDNNIQTQAIDSLLSNVDYSMSSYIDSSLISLINKNHTVALDSLITRVLIRSIEICHETNGMFDVTVAPMVSYWGFGPNKTYNRNNQKASSYSEIVGCDKIILNNNMLFKSDSVSIDLNGIAQGFTVDYLSEYLVSKGVNDFMIEVGGEVRCFGSNLGRGWKIGIDAPTESKHDFAFILNLTNTSLATSGSYRNYYYSDSKKISHTINPKTLMPASNSLLSATVLYDDCMSADAYATACMSFGVEDAKLFLKNNNIAGCLIYLDGLDTVPYLTPSFSSFLH